MPPAEHEPSTHSSKDRLAAIAAAADAFNDAGPDVAGVNMEPDRDGQHSILVVEDNPANQMLIEAVLQGLGYAVTLASSAEEALEDLVHLRPDLILTDIQLGGQDGLSLTRRLKADPATASIPVVAVTAYAMVSDRERILDAGCAGYISKPIDTRTLGSEIAAFLK